MLRPSLSLAGRCAFRPGINMKSYMQSEPQRESPVSKNHPKNWSRWPLEATPFDDFFRKKDEFKFAALQITEDGRFSKLPSFDFSHLFAAFASRRAIGKWGYSFVNLNYEVPIAESKAQSLWWSCLGCAKTAGIWLFSSRSEAFKSWTLSSFEILRGMRSKLSRKIRLDTWNPNWEHQMNHEFDHQIFEMAWMAWRALRLPFHLEKLDLLWSHRYIGS